MKAVSKFQTISRILSLSLSLSGTYHHTMSLFSLAREGNTTELRRRLQAGEDVNQTVDGSTPLHAAAMSASSDVADVLLQAGADVHAVSDYGYTPLHYACDSTNLPVVQTLLSHGADVNAVDTRGDTPLHSACYFALNESAILPIAEQLCDHGTDPYLCDRTGRNAVAVAEERGWMTVLNVLKQCCKFFYECHM